uniref:KIAA0232 n=1 Tax=Salvator merianae TaxID=96440 RepID=A0A8D0DXR3_SALMN
MHPIYTVVVDGLPSESSSSSCLGPVPVSEMSLLHALGPVQTWLGQELEKCGIDAMIYTRYVLSLLLHDNYDYDLQEQENDIFLGWEKGAYKKWGKSKKKCSDLTLEEMKKQAAVQCLRSASDESSGIETLVEELCCKLKDLQSEQETKIHKKLEDSLNPEVDLSPAVKDQVEKYYEAFPPLSKKPVCLQEIMTVWNTSKICSYSSSSSSSTAPATSTDTSSPKDCISESEVSKERNNNKILLTVNERATQKKEKDEKENKFGNSGVEEKTTLYKKQVRHKSEGKIRPRSWSSGSSEEGSNSSSNQGELKTSTKFAKFRHKTREVRSKKGRNGQSRHLAKLGDKAERKIHGDSSSSGSIKLCKRGKRPLKEIRRKEVGNYERKELYFDSRNEKEYKEEPLWYTEPIAEYFVPLSRKSKLETTYRSRQNACDSTSEAVEELAESVQGLCISNNNINKTYLAAGTFIDGHFVEMPAVLNEGIGLTRTSVCSQPEDSTHSDGVHLSELTHFYEVDIDQSMLDSGASGKMQGESRILNMIRQKSKEGTDFEAECCIVFDGMELQGESAIWADSAASGAEGWFLQDLSNLAQFWECCSSSSSGDADGESFGGDSPIRLSPTLDSTILNSHVLAGNQELFSDTNEGSGLNSFSVFEVQCSNSVLPFPFEKLNLGDENADSSSNVGMFGKTQSRLLIWTKNSAFDENEHCSNLSTRTCSPWSYSEETRSDNETLNIPFEESPQFNSDDINYVVPRVSLSYVDEEIIDFLQEEACQEQTRPLGEMPTLIFTKKSKLESVCGIQLEQKDEDKEYETTQVHSNSSPHEDDYGSGVIKDIWTSMSDGSSTAVVEIDGVEEELFSADVNHYCCCLNDAKVEILQDPNKAVQRSEYHLWEGQKENLEKRAFASNHLSKVDCGDYTTPSKPWDINQDKESSFILGGVYGELKTFNSDGEWAVVPPNHPKGNLLQCAASDVVTIAGTDVFMTPGNSFAPGHRQLWRPLVSFEQSEQLKCSDHGVNRGFSFIFHEDLLEACGNFQGEESGLEYSFSSFDLNNPFSQVLHVECTFEPEGIASFSPCFKPKSILCSDSDREVFHPRICGAGRTQYRAIRISPRTHFRPISASELSPCGGSESDFESEKDEGNIPGPSHAEVFDDPQADLKPLEEDAEKEGHYYGKSELESGKFLPRLKKCGMEKSAQTSLDSQEESSGILLENETSCLECGIKDLQDVTEVENSELSCNVVEPQEEEDRSCSCKDNSYEDNLVTSTQLKEFPVLNNDRQKISYNQAKQCWWEKALYTPLFPASQYEDSLQVFNFWNPHTHMHQDPQLQFCNRELKDKAPHIEYTETGQSFGRKSQTNQLHLKCCTNIKSENGIGEFSDLKEMPHPEDHLLDFNMVSSVHEARCADPRSSETNSNGFRKKLYSSDSSNSEGTASEGGNGWADPCEEELFSRTHL